MTPLQIEIMLHYYARTEDYRFGDFSAPTVKEAIEVFCRGDMLNFTNKADYPNAAYVITEKGRAYVDYLRSVPLPVVKYVIEYPHE
jgi:hypothetical protein